MRATTDTTFLFALTLLVACGGSVASPPEGAAGSGVPTAGTAGSAGKGTGAAGSAMGGLAGTAGSGSPPCTPGQQIACEATGDCTSFLRVCDAAGTYGPCIASDCGSAGTSGKGGTAGNGAAGKSGAASTGTGGSGGGGGNAQGGNAQGGNAQGGGTAQGGSGTGGAAGATLGGAGGGVTMSIPPFTVQAAETLLLGDTDWQGVATNGAWTLYGFDIDNQVTTTQSKNHCQPVAGAKPSDVLVDAPNGVDNSFGKNIVPILLGLVSDASAQVDASIAAGNGTITFGVDGGFPPAGDGAGLNGWMVSVVGKTDGAGFVAPTTAQWSDGSYAWSAVASDVAQTSPFTAVTQYPGSSDQAFLLTSSVAPHGTITIPVFGSPFSLPLRNVRFTAQLASDGMSAKVNLGAVMPTAELEAQFKQVAGKLSSSLCSGSALDGILQQVAQASDILQDGTQDPTQTCDAITVGLGAFTRSAQIGAIYSAAPPSPACP